MKELSKNGRGRGIEVEYLLKEGANPNAVTKDGVSMLHAAIRNRHYDCIPVLIKSHADIKAKVPPYALTFWLISIKYLLMRLVNLIKRKGNTVLHEAVLLGPESDTVIKMLLEYFISLDKKLF